MATFAPPASAQLYLGSERVNLATACSVRTLGLVPMHEAGGTTEEVAASNRAKLNAYFAGGWRTYGLHLYFPAGGWAIDDTIVIPRIEGLVVDGAGVGDTRAEVEYTSYGGAVARIVNITPALDLMIDYSGMGLSWRGVQVQGWWHATNAGTLKAATSSFARRGFLQRCGDGVVGSGKVNSPAMVFSCCDVAIQMGDATVGADADNADQWTLGSLRCPDCRIGIHSICRQSVGHWIAQFEGTRCGTMLYLERGGKYHFGQVTLENASPTFLLARDQTFDDNSVVVDELYCDGSISGTPEIADMEASESSKSILLKINLLTVVASTDPVPPKPTITLRGYCRCHILGGEQLFAGMVICHGGNSSFMHEVVVRDVRFRTGEDPATFVSLGSDSTFARVTLANNGNVGNVPFVDQCFRLSRSGGVTTPTEYDPREPQ